MPCQRNLMRSVTSISYRRLSTRCNQRHLSTFLETQVIPQDPVVPSACGDGARQMQVAAVLTALMPA